MSQIYVDPKTGKVDFNRNPDGSIREGSEGITLPDETWGEKAHREKAQKSKQFGDLSVEALKGAARGTIDGVHGLVELGEQGKDFLTGSQSVRNKGIIDDLKGWSDEKLKAPSDFFGSGMKNSEEGRKAMETAQIAGDIGSTVLSFFTPSGAAKVIGGVTKMYKGASSWLKLPKIQKEIRALQESGNLTKESLEALLEKTDPQLLNKLKSGASIDASDAVSKNKVAQSALSDAKKNLAEGTAKKTQEVSDKLAKGGNVPNSEGIIKTQVEKEVAGLSDEVKNAAKALKESKDEMSKAKVVSDLIKGIEPKAVLKMKETHPKLYKFLMTSAYSGSMGAWILGRISNGDSPDAIESDIGKMEYPESVTEWKDAPKKMTDAERDLHQARNQRKNYFDKQEAEYATRKFGLPINSGQGTEGLRGVDKKAENDEEGLSL